MVYLRPLLQILSLLLTTYFVYANQLARGWGDKINWRPLEEGLRIAKETNQPIMLIIHKSWCGACKSLKPKIAVSEPLLELSNNFIMVNTEDDEEPTESQYSPDGGYIPRILFLNSKGKVQNEISNPNGKDQYKYYYWDAADVITSMKEALKHLKDDSIKVLDEL